MKIVNLNPELATVGWTVNHLPAAVRPVIPGLTASFFVKATFRLQPGETPGAWEKGPEHPSGDRMLGDDPEHGVAYASDFVPYKPRAEFTLVGTASAPAPGLRAFLVRARVGSLAKSLDVLGDRVWQGAGPGLPVPVERVPLSYARAWGGLECPTNPLGCGHETDRLPNFELPAARVQNRNARVQPAGFAPIPADWLLRREKLGTYDAEWLETRWPWMPDDFDWTYFNAAPPSQWFDGYLTGDEELEFQHLHAAHPTYRSRLPGLRARGFLSQTVEAEERFHEIPLDLDTVWLDLDAEKLILVWRGRAPVSSLKLKDVSHLLTLVEPLAAPARDYRALLAAAIAPPPTAPPPAASGPDHRAEAEAHAAEARKKMAEIEKAAGGHIAAAEAKRAEIEATAAARGMQPYAQSYAESLARLEARLQRVGAAPGVPPAHNAALASAIAELRALGDPAALVAAETARAEAAVAAAHGAKATAPSPAIPRDPAALAAARQTGFADANLPGVDLAGLDLSGVDFSGAILAGANLTGTRLIGARLERADLSGANLTDARLDGANLTAADLHAATVAGAVWTGVNVRRARLAGLAFGAADLRGVHGEAADFSHAKLAGANLVGAVLPRANFADATAEGANFTEAQLPHADFSRAKAAGADFTGAQLVGFRAGHGADFTGARFLRAKAPESIWKGSTFDRANFQGAQLTRAQFSDARLTDAILDRGDLRDATFEDAILHRAVLTHANLLRALLDRADLTGAVLDGANLFEAGFWNAILAQASWRGANIKRTLLAP